MRICVVDENQLVRRTLQDFLVELGHTVVPLRENGALLSALQAGECHPDLIIAECRDACADKPCILQQIHELTPETPIFATVDNGTVPSPEEAISRGICAFLHKPLHLSELELMLIRLIGIAVV